MKITKILNTLYEPNFLDDLKEIIIVPKNEDTPYFMNKLVET